MATLMDTLKSRLEGEPVKAELGQTERVEKLAQAKTGRASLPSEGPRRTSIQEKSQAQTVNLAGQQQSLQNRLQSETLTQQQQAQDVKAEEARLNLSDRLESYQTAFENQSEDILREFERDTRSLEDSRDSSRTEQLGFLLRLQDQQYLSELKRNGAMDRLNSSVAFKEAAARSALEDQKELFDNDLRFKAFYNSNNRDYKNQLAQMDISFAQQLAANALEGQKNQAIFSGIGSAAGAGFQYEVDKSKTKTEVEE